MIKIYTSPSCSSCRKVKQWFDDQNIPYQERNIFTSTLNENELREILLKSENGTEDIISTRSKIVRDQNIDFDNLTVKQMIEFVKENPSVLKRPIVVDDNKIQVGYNVEEIRSFIPTARRIAERECNPFNCEKFDNCEHRLDALGDGEDVTETEDGDSENDE